MNAFELSCNKPNEPTVTTPRTGGRCEQYATHFEPGYHRALGALARGLRALRHADQGEAGAAEQAIAHLYACLEWVTPQTCACLWVEAQIARADAYALRENGVQLENARAAIACYRAALCVALGGRQVQDLDTRTPISS